MVSRAYVRKLDYEIPDRYRNAFYLANAAFFDSTNWFLHRAYEILFPTLKEDLQCTYKGEKFNDTQIHERLENVVEILDQCNSIIDVRFPIRRDTGRYETVRAFRAHHGRLASSLSLGGLRIHEGITRDHMKALCLLSSMKNHCVGIGMSGAHGGIKLCPGQYSERELQSVVRQYIFHMSQKGYCGKNDVIHPDINTSSRHMDWVSDAHKIYSGETLDVASVGRPVGSGGVEKFETFAALGAFTALELLLNEDTILRKIFVDRGIEGKKFVIQGLGKVGRPLALLLVDKGAVCVGVKEREAYIYDREGIDLKALLRYREEHDSIENYGLAKTDHPDSIFTEDCDILVLAACHKSLVCYVARDVKANIILEAADGPTTPAAHKILVGKSKLVVPDIYACSGTNIASYFEYLKHLHRIGALDDNLLRCNKGIFRGHFRREAECGKAILDSGVGVGDYAFLKKVLECIFTEICQGILTNLETYKLGLDVRTAAYALSVKAMFKNIYDQKAFPK
ncbi:glutamate dehydrogenase, mitochondrial-like [Cylas formicarius]|uniref:glutamate dehydrogenase, mitochondrial-like n=1 Tax=Cylas formicarius TaxID=197179 RepID=UPI0029586D21|nr:glutamate dehydrogenase, mitochondrial-like [Cylas formicarius]